MYLQHSSCMLYKLYWIRCIQNNTTIAVGCVVKLSSCRYRPVSVHFNNLKFIAVRVTTANVIHSIIRSYIHAVLLSQIHFLIYHNGFYLGCTVRIIQKTKLSILFPVFGQLTLTVISKHANLTMTCIFSCIMKIDLIVTRQVLPADRNSEGDITQRAFG